MKSELQRVLLAIEAGRVKRCHCFPTNSDPTVGLHVFGAVSMLLILCPDPTINMIKALQFHDNAERFLGDLPSPAKVNCPELKEVYEAEEEHILIKYGMRPQLDDRERRWVHAMDLMEFLMFIKHELNLGNKYAQQRFNRICAYVEEIKMPVPVVEFYINNLRLHQTVELDDGDF